MTPSYYQRNKAKVIAANLEWRKKNREKEKARWKVRTSELKRETLSIYSNGSMKCACCGESEFQFLTLDHKNNDGNKERKDKRRTGIGFYGWLRKNGFPKDPPLQVLCFNCNCAKGAYGKCPHQTNP